MKSVDLPEGTIRYLDSGRGEPIVFVHGFAVNGALWRKVAPPLSRSFRCIVPDWPLGSHGIAMKRDADLTPPGLANLVVRFLDALRLKRATLVGNDLGGAVCQQVVARRPDRVSHLVLTPCDAFDNFPPPMFRYLVKLPLLPGVSFALAQLMRIKPLRRLPVTYSWLAKHPLDDDVIDGYVRPLIENPGVRRDAAKVITSVAPRYTREVLPALGRFERPVLLAWAVEDRFFPFAHAEQLQGVFPKAVLKPIRDAYTLVAEDQPEELVRAVREFLRPGRKRRAN